mmetsp:Transcript_34935/g.73693  ORF Transcript_34935/g.73693 Transcript_34935/m.73693 type:complete len:259 (+) Transcript_34935:797-1573(+)
MPRACIPRVPPYPPSKITSIAEEDLPPTRRAGTPTPSPNPPSAAITVTAATAAAAAAPPPPCTTVPKTAPTSTPTDGTAITARGRGTCKISIRGGCPARRRTAIWRRSGGTLRRISGIGSSSRIRCSVPGMASIMAAAVQRTRTAAHRPRGGIDASDPPTASPASILPAWAATPCSPWGEVSPAREPGASAAWRVSSPRAATSEGAAAEEEAAMAMAVVPAAPSAWWIVAAARIRTILPGGRRRRVSGSWSWPRRMPR